MRETWVLVINGVLYATRPNLPAIFTLPLLSRCSRFCKDFAQSYLHNAQSRPVQEMKLNFNFNVLFADVGLSKR